MEQLSLLDKFKVLFDNIIAHPIFILILFVPLIMLILQKKHGKKAFIIVYVLVLLFVLYTLGDVIFKLFDNLMDGLFMTLYFPNFITLFVVVILVSVIALISFLKKDIRKVNKIINIISFAIVQMLFVLVLTIIKSKNINIYADNALYSNNDVLTLMQLLIGTFTLQVISLLIIYGINKVTDILENRNKELSDDIQNQIDLLSKTKKKDKKFKITNLDNEKVGFINVANKEKTSKPKLKAFKFDVDKLESITLNAPIKVEISEPGKLKPVKFNVSKLNSVKVNAPIKNKKFKTVNLEDKVVTINPELEPIKEPVSKVEPTIEVPKVEKVPIMEPLQTPKESTMKPILGGRFKKEEPKIVQPKKDKNKFIVDVKPNLMEVHEEDLKPVKPINLVDNLNILDIQSTLDTVIKYKLVRKSFQTVSDMAVDNLQIPNFELTMSVLLKYKLYKSH